MWDTTGPTYIHNLIIQLAFPGLNPGSIKNIQKGSLTVDIPTTILESHANEHAMRRPGQTIEQARQGDQQFIDTMTTRAAEVGPWAGGGGITNDFALYYFGEAIHSIMDNTSPAHMPFQLYDKYSRKRKSG